MAAPEVISLLSSPLATSAISGWPQHLDSPPLTRYRYDDDFFQSCQSLGINLTANLSPMTSPEKSQKVPSRDASILPRSIGSTHLPGGSFRRSVARSDGMFDYFPSERAQKRRKLSPKPATSLVQRAIAEADLVYDLSSDDRVDDMVSQHNTSNGINVGFVDLGVSEDELPDLGRLVPTGFDLRQRKLVNLGSPHDVEIATGLSADAKTDGNPAWNYSRPERTSQPPSKPTSSIAEVTGTVNQGSNGTNDHRKSKNSRERNPITVSCYAKVTKSSKASVASVFELDDILDSSQPQASKKCHATAKSMPKMSAADRDIEKERRAVEKEAGKEQARLDKERKAAEKRRIADIAEANKRKTDKQVSTKEMIVDLPCLFKTTAIGEKVEEKIKQLGGDFTYYTEELHMTGNSVQTQKMGNIVKWRRNVDSEYDEALEEFVPLSKKKAVSENHILVHLAADAFCAIAVSGTSDAPSAAPARPNEKKMKENLNEYVRLLRSSSPGCTIVLLLEDLSKWHKKNTNAKNKAYADAVRAQPTPLEALDLPSSTLAPKASSRASKQRKAPSPQVDLSFITVETTEALQLHLQLAHQPLKIQHCTSSETWAQIIAFTQHLSTRPYRHVELDRNLSHASFCMTSGQVKTGQGDPHETWIRMLEQVNRLTKPMALGLNNAGYDSPMQLVNVFKDVERNASGAAPRSFGDSEQERRDKEKAKLMLQDVKRAVSLVGDAGDKRLGPQMSRRLYKIFMGRDPDMRDGIA